MVLPLPSPCRLLATEALVCKVVMVPGLHCCVVKEEPFGIAFALDEAVVVPSVCRSSMHHNSSQPVLVVPVRVVGWPFLFLLSLFVFVAAIFFVPVFHIFLVLFLNFGFGASFPRGLQTGL